MLLEGCLSDLVVLPFITSELSAEEAEAALPELFSADEETA